MKLKWSHSGLKDFENCPRRYHEVKVLKKYPMPDTEQIRYGKELHKAAEDYVRDNVPLPEQFLFVKPTIDALLTKPGRRYPELEMALTEDLNPCSFGAEEYWVRGIVDLLIINGDSAHIVDYKTGSAKYPDVKQLRLMSLMTYAHFPQVNHIKAGLLFVAHNTFIDEEYKRDQVSSMWEDFIPELERLRLSYEQNRWPENPNPLCGWCPVTTCQFQRIR